jgi:6-phosphogluconolactonase
VEIVVRPDGEAVAREAIERVLVSAAQAVSSRGRFIFALAGGSTPAVLYELLASPEFIHRVDWARTEVFFGDERCVPPDHEWSNYRMARQALLDHVPIRASNVHRIAGELGPDAAAAAYTATMGTVFVMGEGALPRFDLILLGMGDDAHTASLFPGMPALLEREAWAVGTPVPEYVRPQVRRVTLTLPVLNAARQVMFLVTGSAKAEPVRRVLLDAGHDPAAAALPAARVRPEEGALAWLLDQPAAAWLRSR